MSTESDLQPDANPLSGHVVVAGYGVPGRVVGDFLTSHHITYCVIELNTQVVHRCAPVVPIIEGDVTNESVLRRAGIERCTLFAITVPSDPAVLEAISIARRLNPTVRIMARCRFISTGMEARRRGANQVVIEEQAVAEHFLRALQKEADADSDDQNKT